MDSSEVLIRAEHVSKKFCRSLKRSLWYGTQDLTHTLLPWKQQSISDKGGVGGGYQLPPLRRDEFWALQDVSFEVKRGECLGLIGHNGAGKSTLLKMLNCLIRPDRGRITVTGRVGALIDLNAGFNPVLTGRENIYNQAALFGFSKKETDTKFDAIVEFSELEEFLDTPVQNYSSGMGVRLGFATITQLQMDVLLIDEVLAVGDLGFTFKCLNRLGEIMPETAVVFVSHNMPMTARVCDQVMVLASGKPPKHTHDVVNGIHSYVSGFSGLESKDLGNGAVILKSIAMHQEISDGVHEVSNSESFINGNSLRFRLEFAVLNIPDEEVFLVLKIYDQQLRECVNSFSHDAQRACLRITTDSLKVRVTLPKLFLNQGRHYVSMALEGVKTGKVYCHATNVSTFVVRSNVHGWATSTIPGKWDISS